MIRIIFITILSLLLSLNMMGQNVNTHNGKKNTPVSKPVPHKSAAASGKKSSPEKKQAVKRDPVPSAGTYIDGHYYVDLGLPSGTLWATTNVGASSPTEYGDLYAWGETSPKAIYSWDTYRLCQGGDKFKETKYCKHERQGALDNRTTLEPSDDAATAHWGRGWQMPTAQQCSELISSNNTKHIWMTYNGVNGYMITSLKNGNTIFLPAGGLGNNDPRYGVSNGVEGLGKRASYWSCSLYLEDSYDARTLSLLEAYIQTSCGGRYLGCFIRPVRAQ